MTRVVVIGAGVLGASIAWRLAEAGHEITVADARAGGVATRGSFGWLNAASGQDANYIALRRRSLEMWHAIVREHPGCPAAFPGMLTWESPEPELDSMQQVLSGLGHAAELVARARILDIEPNMADPPDAALWLPTEGRAEPRTVADWFLRAAVSAGAIFRSEHATVIGRRKSLWEIVFGAERVLAEELVIAAGAATAELLATLGHPIGLRTEPGLLVRTAPAAMAVLRVLGTPDVHLWQAADGSVLAGSDYGGAREFEDAEFGASSILRHAEALLPALGALQADAVSVTERPMLSDDRPAVGRLEDGLSVAVTHSGMTLAPIVAAAIAGVMDDRPTCPEFAPYRPDRPALRPTLTAGGIGISCTRGKTSS